MDDSVGVGERVRHKERTEVGIGIVTAIYADDHCDVTFNSCTFSWVEMDVFVSVDAEILAARREDLRAQVLALARGGDGEAADRLYEELCAGWWSISEYQSAKFAAEVEFAEA